MKFYLIVKAIEVTSLKAYLGLPNSAKSQTHALRPKPRHLSFVQRIGYRIQTFRPLESISAVSVAKSTGALIKVILELDHEKFYSKPNKIY